MPKKPKLEIVGSEQTASIIKPNGFDLSRFQPKHDPTIPNVGTLLSRLPILKMAAAKDYIRTHSNEEYWSPTLSFVDVPIKGDRRDSTHLITDELATRFLPSGRIQRYRLVLASKPHDVFFLCIMPSDNLDNPWNQTTVEAGEKAKTTWIQLTSRKAEGVENYRVDYALDDDAFPEPQWPKQPLAEIVITSFTGLMIDREDHAALLRLIGARQRSA
jgi:hypothetical protein